MRFLFLGLALLAAHAAADDEVIQRVLVDGARASQLGVLDAASAGSLGQKELDARPVYRPGELLEAVPGLVVTQHSGEGKANQFYLRGFNLDHGTDLRTTLDDMPLNQRSHAHGQGWTDLNILIPELTARLDYRKGPYNAAQGDFAAAGGADISYVNRLPRAIASAGVGEQGYARALVAGSPPVGDGALLYGLELLEKDGPFTTPEGYHKINAILRYSEGFANNGWSATAMLMRSHWHASDQIPLRALATGQIGRFGTVDPSDGGASERASLSLRWRRTESDSSSKISAYIVRNTLDLYSNFTYFADDPVHGDQFAQPDQRVTSGVDASHTWHWHEGERRADLSIGLQGQHDNIFNGLQKTQARQILAVERADHILESSLGAWAEAGLRWNPLWRVAAGLRMDAYRFALQGSDRRTAHLASPSLALVMTPSDTLELYANTGGGFHSNDARAVVHDGADGLVRARAWELGLRDILSPRWQMSLAVYRLDLGSELVWAGDAGTTEASRASRRTGVEWSNYWKWTRSLSLDADLALAEARFRGHDPAGDHIPESVQGVAALALLAEDGPWSGALRWRWFGPRPLNEDASVRSTASAGLNARIAYNWSKQLRLEAEVFNLTDRHDSAIDYYYASRLKNEAGAQNDIHFHPVEPRSLRVLLIQRF